MSKKNLGPEGQPPLRLSDVDIQKILQTANEDEACRCFMGACLAMENICIRTDVKSIYLRVLEDGRITRLEEKPGKSYKLEATETYLSQLWQRYLSGQAIAAREVKRNIKIPLRVQMKIALGGLT